MGRNPNRMVVQLPLPLQEGEYYTAITVYSQDYHHCRSGRVSLRIKQYDRYRYGYVTKNKGDDFYVEVYRAGKSEAKEFYKIHGSCAQLIAYQPIRNTGGEYIATANSMIGFEDAVLGELKTLRNTIYELLIILTDDYYEVILNRT